MFSEIFGWKKLIVIYLDIVKIRPEVFINDLAIFFLIYKICNLLNYVWDFDSFEIWL